MIYDIRFPYGVISIWDGSSKIFIRRVRKRNVIPFVDAVNEQLARIKQGSGVSSLVVDIASQLEKLAQLKDKGIITQEEFEQQKAKLLAL